MPLIIDSGRDGARVPTRWAERQQRRPVASASGRAPQGCVRLGFINNMPDPALEDTEMQFFEMLDAASGEIPVAVKLYSLPGIPRGDRGQQHLNNFYFGFDDLWNSKFDGVIVTGTEPHQANLQDEPYWSTLTQVFDWAERNTSSTVLSCLAAHASVLHSDGILRHRLADKQFGVFASRKNGAHALTGGIADEIRFPHSRWNEVRAAELSASGYTVLTDSVEAGVDLFVKRKKNSLFVHFQGHPEYGAQTLLKEYRRDIKRFLRQERETYPTMPAGYFGEAATRLLNDFRETAIADRREEIAAAFPENAVVGGLENSWASSANAVYRNWLRYLDSRKTESPVFAAMARAGARPALAESETA
ncbi:MAG TPA: homoserine O-succinyltransferase [Candidatus Binatus sp.]|nr:homoserine O-succinyltransferase [Candidatus Binatus sp.]